MLQVAYLLLALSATKVNGSPIGDTKLYPKNWQLNEAQHMRAELFGKKGNMKHNGKLFTFSIKNGGLDLLDSFSAAQHHINSVKS